MNPERSVVQSTALGERKAITDFAAQTAEKGDLQGPKILDFGKISIYLRLPRGKGYCLFSVLNLLRCCSFGTSCPLLAEYPESHQLTTDYLMVPATLLPLVQILAATDVICTAARSVSSLFTAHHVPGHHRQRFVVSSLCLPSTLSFSPSFEVHIRICHPTLLESTRQRS